MCVSLCLFVSVRVFACVCVCLRVLVHVIARLCGFVYDVLCCV